MTYELTTIKDIFLKVPADRIEDCLKELAAVMIQSKQVQEFTDSLLDDLHIEMVCRFPDTLTWNDDGKRQITTIATINGKPIFKLERVWRGEDED